MKTLSISVAALALASTTCAQFTQSVRSGFQLSNRPNANSDDRLRAPKEDLAPQAGVTGSVHTGQLVHATWIGPDDDGIQSLFYRRSTTGGCDFEAEQKLWTVQPGEQGIDSDYRLVCAGHEVYIVLTTDRMSNGMDDPNDRDHTWIVASDQQGITGTFQSVHASNGQEVPLSTGDDGADVDGPEACCTPGRLHVVWEYDFDFAAGIGGPSSEEDAYYQRFDWVGGTLTPFLPEELKFETTASGLVDTDAPGVYCKNGLVVLVWQDDRTVGSPGNNAQNDTFIRVSKDGGQTFGTEQNLTNFTTPGSFGYRESKICIFGTAAPYAVAVFMEDSRNLNDDDIYFGVSYADGDPGTFSFAPGPISRSPAMIDSDGSFPACTDNGILYLVYADDRNGPGNAINNAFVVVDQSAGLDFLNGTYTEQQLSLGSRGGLAIDVTDDYAAVGFIDNIAGPDPAAIAFTVDDGTTWNYRQLVDTASIDQDGDVALAVTTRGDLVASAIDDRLGGNPFNEYFALGLRASELSYDAGTSAFSATYIGEPGDTCIIFPSLTAPACGAFAVDPMNGIQSDFSADALSFAVASNLLPFVTVADANGNAVWPFPNFAPILGMPIYWLAAGTDPATGDVRRLTDTIEQN